MTDLKIPNLNKNSEKFFFKKKLTLRRKSKSKLLKESFLMLSFGVLIIYLNYLIPSKKLILTNFSNNVTKLFANFLDSIYYIYEICLAILIITSLILSLILFLGSLSRSLKIVKRKTRRVKFK